MPFNITVIGKCKVASPNCNVTLESTYALGDPEIFNSKFMRISSHTIWEGWDILPRDVKKRFYEIGSPVAGYVIGSLLSLFIRSSYTKNPCM